jgi:hypothetical protein
MAPRRHQHTQNAPSPPPRRRRTPCPRRRVRRRASAGPCASVRGARLVRAPAPRRGKRGSPARTGPFPAPPAGAAPLSRRVALQKRRRAQPRRVVHGLGGCCAALACVSVSISSASGSHACAAARAVKRQPRRRGGVRRWRAAQPRRGSRLGAARAHESTQHPSTRVQLARRGRAHRGVGGGPEDAAGLDELVP